VPGEAEKARSLLTGADLFAVDTHVKRGLGPAAEEAMWDAIGKIAGQPLCRRFLCAYAAEARLGGPERRRLERRAAVHEALALVHVAISSWRHAKPARLARARSLLEEGGMWPRR